MEQTEQRRHQRLGFLKVLFVKGDESKQRAPMCSSVLILILLNGLPPLQ
jgi:hypothetical protein